MASKKYQAIQAAKHNEARNRFLQNLDRKLDLIMAEMGLELPSEMVEEVEEEVIEDNLTQPEPQALEDLESDSDDAGALYTPYDDDDVQTEDRGDLE